MSMALVTDPYYGVLTLKMASSTSLSLNPTCVPAMPCTTPLLNTSGVPSGDYTVAVYEEKSTSLAVDTAGTTSSEYSLVFRTVPFWEFVDYADACFATMTSYLQLESVTGFDLTVGFEKGAYAAATSVELDASQGATIDWIQAMPTTYQSFFISAYLPQFTEDFSFEVFAAPTVSVHTPPPYITISTAPSASTKALAAYRRELQPYQEALAIRSSLSGDNRAILAIVITLSFLVLFGGCMTVLCWVKSIRSRSSETSGSIGSERAEINGASSVAATMSETIFRAEPVQFHGTFSNSEPSVPRHSYSSARFQLGSSVSSDSSSSSSDTEFVITFNSLDDPLSDTALISSLAREASPDTSPRSADPQHEQAEGAN